MQDLESSLRQDEHPLEVWDRLLSKYVSVWLWSVLFGTASGLGTGLTYILFSKGGQWGPLWPAIVLAALSGLAATLYAWWCLYLFLARVLLPQFLGTDQPEPTSRSGYYLQRAFVSILLASSIGIITMIINFIFEELR